MQIIRTIVAAALLTVAAHAEAVYMSAHGKTYHKTEECMSLKRATHVYTADEAEAKSHGLHQCAICFREKKAGASAGAQTWAKETGKKEAAK